MRTGSALEKKLRSIGVTTDRYALFKDAIGFPPGCNCAERKDWLNTVPDAFLAGGVKGAQRAVKEWRRRWKVYEG